MSELSDVVDDIKAGSYDGQLVSIIEAVQLRFQHGTTALKWRVRWEDHTFTEDDLTLAEAATVEKLTGSSWGTLNPLSSAQDCQSIVASCLHHRTKVTLKDALAEAGKVTVDGMVDRIDSYEVDRAPKA
jgi:hypothetical protein